MKIILDKPYMEDWTDGYLVKNPEGRTNVVLYNRNNKMRSTTSLARYKLSVKLGRYLDSEEHVDHIDEDKTNDDIDNLQILSPADNNRKHIKLNNKEAKFLILNCPKCNEPFLISLRNYKSRQKNNKNIFCSRSCARKFYTIPHSLIKKIRDCRANNESCYTIAKKLKVARNTVMKYW